MSVATLNKISAENLDAAISESLGELHATIDQFGQEMEKLINEELSEIYDQLPEPEPIPEPVPEPVVPFVPAVPVVPAVPPIRRMRLEERRRNRRPWARIRAWWAS